MIDKTLTQVMTVQEKDTAAVYGSGKLPVFATPALVAFMENTAMNCLEGVLAENEDSVGIEICVQHLKATPVGGQITCTAKITNREGRKISFELEAYDEKGMVGKATHDRFIIDPEKFMNKLS